MWLGDILTRARDAGNAKHYSRPLRALLRAWRRGGPVRTGITLAGCGLLLRGVPFPLSGLLLPISILFVGLNLLIDLIYGALDPRVREG